MQHQLCYVLTRTVVCGANEKCIEAIHLQLPNCFILDKVEVQLWTHRCLHLVFGNKHKEALTCNNNTNQMVRVSPPWKD